MLSLTTYSGQPLSAEVQALELSYYVDDSKDSMRDSPNKSDVCVKDNNSEKIKKPRWVKTLSEQVVCSCIYCINLRLICVALKNIMNTKIKLDDHLLNCLYDKIRNENC
ncbi:hypothetical protein PR048_006399 [Dryococelus australis]|uniref:Uncharacterized protein n=1 Tax=Dryococelus australis TaxID=614101 RepID=A0ABQ9ID43_9NEOP|nr:hypothetical protein PR048_006399 [Dryococelus australis]